MYTLEIRNIGCIEYMREELSNLNMISGDNNSGKSTVGKILYTIVKSSIKLSKELKKAYSTLTEPEIGYVDPQFMSYKIIDSYLHSIIGENYITKNSGGKALITLSKVENEIPLFHFRRDPSPEYTLENQKGTFASYIDVEGIPWKDCTIIRTSEILNYSGLINSAKSDLSESYDPANLVIDYDKDLITKLITVKNNSFWTMPNSELSKSIREAMEPIKKISEKLTKSMEPIKELSEVLNDKINMITYEAPKSEIPKFDYNIHKIQEVFTSDRSIDSILFDNVGSGKSLIRPIYTSKENTTTLSFDRYNNSLIMQDGDKYKADQVGTGIKLFSILEKLESKGYLDKDFLVIIEEPEEGLHVDWQIDIMKLLEGYKCTKIVTTHNALLGSVPDSLNSVDITYLRTKKNTKYYNIIKTDSTYLERQDLNAMLRITNNRI